MHTFARVVAVGTALLALAPVRAGEKEAREVIERAIKAHGGADALARTLVSRRTDRGTQQVGDREVAFVSHVTRRLPDKVRLKIDSGKDLTTTLVLDGEVCYQSDGGAAAVRQLGPRTREVQEEAYLWWITTLAPLTGPAFTLTSLPEAKINGEAAVGVKVAHKGHADTKLYFTKATGRLLRAERRVSFHGVPIDKEYDYTGYKRFGSAILPTRETEKHNKRKWMEFTTSDYTFPDRIEDSTFAKP